MTAASAATCATDGVSNGATSDTAIAIVNVNAAVGGDTYCFIDVASGGSRCCYSTSTTAARRLIGDEFVNAPVANCGKVLRCSDCFWGPGRPVRSD